MAKGTKQAQSNKQNQGKAKSGANQGGNANSAIEMLKQDHRKVEQLFDQFAEADEQRKEQLVEQICAELIVHARLEEEIFYPACREAGVEDEKMDESQVEHDGAKMLINDLLEADSGTPYFAAKVSVLKEMIKHHVAEEEKPREGVFAQAQAHQIDDRDLAHEIMLRKQELQQSGVGHRPARPVALGMAGGTGSMGGGGRRTGYGDDQRFRGENERGYGARSRYEQDEYEGGYSRGGQRGGGYEGDWNEGRYGGSREQTDNRRYEEDDRRLRQPYEDRDEDRRYGRGQGGWFEARRSDDDDRRRHRVREDDHRRPGRGGEHGGWFGDSRGHADASRRGWQHRR